MGSEPNELAVSKSFDNVQMTYDEIEGLLFALLQLEGVTSLHDRWPLVEPDIDAHLIKPLRYILV